MTLHPVTELSHGMFLCLPSNEMMSRFVFLQLICNGSVETFDFLNAHLALSFPLFHPLAGSNSSVFLSVIFFCLPFSFHFMFSLHLSPADLHLLQIHLLASSLKEFWRCCWPSLSCADRSHVLFRLPPAPKAAVCRFQGCARPF